MTGNVIPFERPTSDGASAYEIVEIVQGVQFDPVEYLVALAGPRKSRHEGRLPWTMVGWFESPAEAVSAAASASRRHGCLPIWDGVGIISPDTGSGTFLVRADHFGPGDAA